jgi:hypothetical protein
MSFTVATPLPLYAGAAAVTIRVTAPGSPTRVNGGADDAMADTSSDGLFVATVAEDLVGTYTYLIYRSGTAIQSGWFRRVTGQAAVVLDDERDFRTKAEDVIAETALVGAINGAVSVLPAVGISADRSPGVTLNAFVGETITQSITIYQTDGSTPFVLTGKTLVVVFETRQGTDVATVTSGSITIGGDDDNVVTFAYPSDATLTQRVLKFAIRDASAPKTVYLQGLLNIQRAPQVD